MFNMLKINPADIAAAESEWRAGFAASGKPGGFEENAARVVSDRLAKRPGSYVEYGPYWWAVKAALAEFRVYLGDECDVLVRDAYRADTPIRSIIAGELCRTIVNRTYFAGNTRFKLDDEGSPEYVLEDADMLARAQRGRA